MKIYELQNLLTPSLPATTGSILEPLDSFLYRAMSSPNSAVHHCDFKPTNPSTRKEGRNEGRQEKIYSPECKKRFQICRQYISRIHNSTGAATKFLPTGRHICSRMRLLAHRSSCMQVQCLLLPSWLQPASGQNHKVEIQAMREIRT